jgi:hypothetical protein
LFAHRVCNSPQCAGRVTEQTLTKSGDPPQQVWVCRVCGEKVPAGAK